MIYASVGTLRSIEDPDTSFTPTAGFTDAKREQNGFVTGLEKNALHWMAKKIPPWINPDHLTALGFIAMILAGISYTLSANDSLLLHISNA